MILLQSQASPARTLSGAGLEIPFLPAGNDLNNREAAAALWLLVIAAALLAWPSFRPFIRNIIDTLMSPVILVAIGSLGSWIVLLCAIGSRVGLWTPALIKDTTIWFGGVAIVTLFRTNQAAKDPDYFTKLIRDPITFTALIEFVSNLFVFPFVVELFLIPVATVTAILAGAVNSPLLPSTTTAAARRQTGCVLNWCLGVIGFAVVGFSIWQIVVNRSAIDWSHQIRIFMLPIWLTAATIPFLYFVTLLSEYQAAFSRIAQASPGWKVSFRNRLALFGILGLRVRAVARFVLPWTTRLAETQSLSEASTVVKLYRRTL